MIRNYAFAMVFWPKIHPGWTRIFSWPCQCYYSRFHVFLLWIVSLWSAISEILMVEEIYDQDANGDYFYSSFLCFAINLLLNQNKIYLKVQFVIIMAHAAQFFFMPCDYPIFFSYLIFSYAFLFMCLFSNFYIQEFIHRQAQREKAIKNDPKKIN